MGKRGVGPKKGTRYPGRDDVEVKSCIFCGKSPLTGEHLFPDWFRTIIPRDEKTHRWEHNFAPSSRYRSRVRENAPGDLLHTKLKVVCQGCNGGWMSQLQNRAKPIVAPLLRGDRVFLDREPILTLASWFTMIAMVGEFTDPYRAKVTVSQEARYAFMKNPQPLPGWFFLIGRMDDPEYRLHRHSAGYIRPANAPDELPEDHQGMPNVQATTFVVGHLFLHAFGTADLVEYDFYDFHQPEVRSLLLGVMDPFAVPFGSDLSYPDARRISGILMDHARWE